MRHNLANIQSVNNLLPGTVLLALEKFKTGSLFVSCHLKPPDHQTDQFQSTAPFGYFPEDLAQAKNQHEGDILHLLWFMVRDQLQALIFSSDKKFVNLQQFNTNKIGQCQRYLNI